MSTVFTSNPERLLGGDIAAKFLAAVVGQSRVKALLSDDHFSVDGTLIEAWASMKSFKPKEGEAANHDDDGNGGASGAGGSGEAKAKRRNAERDFHGEKRTNATHASTDPDARLFKKTRGQAAKLCHMCHVLMENRHGLVVDATLTHASGIAEREAALTMVSPMKGVIASRWRRTRPITQPTLSLLCATWT
jgi:hypothetical protein